MQLSGKRIVVTGGAGFLGRFVCRELEAYSPDSLVVPRSANYDLRDIAAVNELYRDSRPDVVIHLAAVIGGIGANRENPARYFYDNAMMGLLLIDAAHRHRIAKFVTLSTICAYPKFTAVPFREEDLWNGYPEETNAPYGLAKKMLLVQSQAYRQQYGLNAITLLPVNLYGPGDNFDLSSSHVIPALIRKVIEAKEQDRRFVEVWGTGNASREFLFVQDAARAIALAAEHYDKPEPVNIGSGEEIRIDHLVKIICELCEFPCDIHWDTTRPDGQPRRSLDVSRAKSEFGFSAKTALRAGLLETIQWYRNNRFELSPALSKP